VCGIGHCPVVDLGHLPRRRYGEATGETPGPGGAPPLRPMRGLAPRADGCFSRAGPVALPRCVCMSPAAHVLELDAALTELGPNPPPAPVAHDDLVITPQ
jgi:hypothetical protein